MDGEPEGDEDDEAERLVVAVFVPVELAEVLGVEVVVLDEVGELVPLGVAEPVLETETDDDGEDVDEPDFEAEIEAVPVRDPDTVADIDAERVELLDERELREADGERELLVEADD